MSAGTPVRVTGRLAERYAGFAIAVGSPPDGPSLPAADGDARFASSTGWTYDERSGRYRDLESGAYLPADRVIELRDAFVEARRAGMVDVSRQLVSDVLSPAEWEAAMRAEIKMAVGIEYAFGRGGILAMRASDWARVERLVEEQWEYLEQFGEDIDDDEVSPAQLLARASMYSDAGVRAFEEGQSAAWEIDLPEYPGERCEGLTNCRCYWSLVENDDGSVDATWIAVGDKDTCGPCDENAEQYNPLHFFPPSEPGGELYAFGSGTPVAVDTATFSDPAALQAYVAQKLDAVARERARFYSDDQPRDDHGRWDESGGGSSGGSKKGERERKVRLGKITERARVEQTARLALGRELSMEQLAGLVGAPEDAVVNITAFREYGHEGVAIYATHPSLEDEAVAILYPKGSYAEDFTPGHSTRLHYEQLYLKPSARGDGRGVQMMAQAVENARRAGIPYVELHAEGNGPKSKNFDRYEKENGYYTWARMGFDGPLHGAGRKSWPDKFRDAKTVGQVLSKKGGAAFWKEHGSDQNLWIETARDSPGRKVMDAYLKEKKLSTYAEDGEAVADEQPRKGKVGSIYDPTPENEAILDRIWASADFYSDDQPRDEGGRWTEGGGGGSSAGTAVAERPSSASSPRASRSRVTVMQEPKVKHLVQEALGRDMDPQELVSLTGAPADAEFEIKPADYVGEPGVDIIVEHPDLTFAKARLLPPGTPGGHGGLPQAAVDAPRLHYEWLYVKPEAQGNGKGVQIMAQAVANAEKAGIPYVDLYAAGAGDSNPNGYGSQGENGFYTWARLGFNGRIREESMRAAKPSLRDARDLHDLMSRPGGADYWKHYGDQMPMYIETRAGSAGRRIMDGYLKEKGLSTYAEDVERSADEFASNPPSADAPPRGVGSAYDPTPENEAILDRVWARVMSSGRPVDMAGFAGDEGEGEGRWVTINGNPVFINAEGEITKGAARLVGKTLGDLRQEGRAKEGSARTREATSQVPHTRGKPDGAGTLKDPIAVGGDIERAAQLIGEGKHVRLDQPHQVSTLLNKLAANVDDARAKGAKAPSYDLGKVSIPGTNLFTLESKGIPRVEMPQLKGNAVPGSEAAKHADSRGRVDISDALLREFREQGIRTSGSVVPAATLRATQKDLDGAKVAGMVKSILAGDLKEEAIFVSRDNYVIDGHHRWAAKVGIDMSDNKLGDVKQRVIRVDADIGEVLDFTRQFAKEMGVKQEAAFNLGAWFLRALRWARSGRSTADFYSEDQERDESGRWTSGGGSSSGKSDKGEGRSRPTIRDAGWKVYDSSMSGRPSELRPHPDSLPEELNRASTTHVYRGITAAEATSIATTGHVQSTGAYSHSSEGTSFADDFATAESAINYGRDNPARTSQPTYVIEVARGPDIVTDKRDYWPKAAGPLPADRISRVWQFTPRGAVRVGEGGLDDLRALVDRADFYSDDQPRDEAGRWAETGGGGGSSEKSEKAGTGAPAHTRELARLGVAPTSSYLEHATASLDKSAALIAGRLGTTPEQVKEKATERIRDFMKDAEFKTRVSEEVLASMFKYDETEFKNQLQTGHSQGLLNVNERMNIEGEAFGAPTVETIAPGGRHADLDDPAAAHPKYGYFENPRAGVNTAMEMYGGVEVTFKPDVLDRTTITLGDSFKPFQERTVLPTPARDADWRAAIDPEALHTAVNATSLQNFQDQLRYVEGQVHGPLKLTDIASIRLDHVYNPEPLRAGARARGIPLTGADERPAMPSDIRTRVGAPVPAGRFSERRLGVVAQRGPGVFLLSDGKQAWLFNERLGRVSEPADHDSFLKFGSWTEPHADVDEAAIIDRARQLGQADFYSDDQPRDDNGRWTSGGGGGADSANESQRERARLATTSKARVQHTPEQKEMLHNMQQVDRMPIYAQERALEEATGWEVELEGLDQDLTLPAVKAFGQLGHDYPAANVSVIQAFEPQPGMGWVNTAYAQYQAQGSEGGRIGLNPDQWGPQSGRAPWAESAREAVEKGAESGWFNDVALRDPQGYLAAHEYGHAIAREIIGRDARSLVGWQAQHPPDQSLSTYSKQNAGEQFAETFAAYYYGSDHPHAASIGEFLKDHYGSAPRMHTEPLPVMERTLSYEESLKALGFGADFYSDDQPRDEGGRWTSGGGGGGGAKDRQAGRESKTVLRTLTPQRAISALKDPEEQRKARALDPYMQRERQEILLADAMPGKPDVDLGSLDPVTMETSVVALAQLGQDYPMVSEKIVMVGDPREAEAKWGFSRMPPQAAAGTASAPSTGESAIGFNPRYYGSETEREVDIRATVIDTASRGWAPPEAARYGEVWTSIHEYGHAVGADLAHRDPAAFRAMEFEIRTSDPVSTYASTSPYEAFAETFAVYYTRGTSGAATDLGETLKNVYGKAPQAPPDMATLPPLVMPVDVGQAVRQREADERAMRILGLSADFYSEDQPRDDAGRWTEAGGGGGSSGGAKTAERPYRGVNLTRSSTWQTSYPKLNTSSLAGAVQNAIDPPHLPSDTAEQRLHDLFDRAVAQGHADHDANWYVDKHNQVGQWAKDLGVDQQRFSDAVAATSPLTNWDLRNSPRLPNLEAARAMVLVDRAHPDKTPEQIREITPRTGGHPFLGNSAENAIRALRGEDRDEVFRAPKIRSFANNLSDPEGAYDVTVDTHVGRILLDLHEDTPEAKKAVAELIQGRKQGRGPTAKTVGGYGWAADRVRVVAEERGMLPSVLQAVVWEQWRREGGANRPRAAKAKMAAMTDPEMDPTEMDLTEEEMWALWQDVIEWAEAGAPADWPTGSERDDHD